MPYWKFISYAAIGSVIWIGGLGILGNAVGGNWEHWRKNLEYVDYAVLVLVVVGIAYLIVRRVRARQQAATDVVSK
jgi:membrane protein DedA with SNARE-associated domain